MILFAIIKSNNSSHYLFNEVLMEIAVPLQKINLVKPFERMAFKDATIENSDSFFYWEWIIIFYRVCCSLCTLSCTFLSFVTMKLLYKI